VVYRGLYSYRRVGVITLLDPKHFLSLFLHVEQVCARVQVAHLHNAARALQLPTNLEKDRMWFTVVCTLIDYDMRHHSGQNLLWPRHFDHCDDAYRCR